MSTLESSDGSQIIELDEGKRTRLTAKLEEYRARFLKNMTQPPEARTGSVDVLMKIAVLDRLLATSRANMSELSNELSGQQPWDAQVFEDAFNIISSYNTGDHSRLRHGTGLPPVETQSA